MFSAVRQSLTRTSRLVRSVTTTPHSRGEPIIEAAAFALKGFNRSMAEATTEATAPLTPGPTTPIRPSASTHFSDLPPAEDPLLQYFTNRLMKHGERQRAQKEVSRVLLHLHAFTRAPPLPLFRKAIETAAPAVRVVSNKVGAKVMIRPVALHEKRRVMYAVSWIIDSCKKGKGRGQTRAEKIAREMINILNGEDSTLAKKEEVHKAAVANRYVHTTASTDNYIEYFVLQRFCSCLRCLFSVRSLLTIEYYIRGLLGLICSKYSLALRNELGTHPILHN